MILHRLVITANGSLQRSTNRHNQWFRISLEYFPFRPDPDIFYGSLTCVFASFFSIIPSVQKKVRITSHIHSHMWNREEEGKEGSMFSQQDSQMVRI